MPRYFFDMMDDAGTSFDEEGLEIQAWQQVRDEAARALGDMTRSEDARIADRMSVRVRDQSGTIMEVHFAFERMH